MNEKIFKVYEMLSLTATVLNMANIPQHRLDRFTSMLDKLLKLAPAGGSYHGGPEFISVRSNDTRLVFRVPFEENAETLTYEVFVTPVFGGFNIKVSGADSSYAKDTIAEDFRLYLNGEVPE